MPKHNFCLSKQKPVVRSGKSEAKTDLLVRDGVQLTYSVFGFAEVYFAALAEARSVFARLPSSKLRRFLLHCTAWTGGLFWSLKGLPL